MEDSFPQPARRGKVFRDVGPGKGRLFQTIRYIVSRRQIHGKLLHYSGQQFALLAAPTRSGKGVGIVIPNLLSYKSSVVVLDIKQENFNLTSGYRKEVLGQEVYLFNPFAEDGRTLPLEPVYLCFFRSRPAGIGF